MRRCKVIRWICAVPDTLAAANLWIILNLKGAQFNPHSACICKCRLGCLAMDGVVSPEQPGRRRSGAQPEGGLACSKASEPDTHRKRAGIGGGWAVCSSHDKAWDDSADFGSFRVWRDAGRGRSVWGGGNQGGLRRDAQM